ncbi:MAG: hypothetical protein IRY99_01340 [Isosphaeraceae bacterium]|nr:hypothetical protein [Isosphaeraceae bacterium]
MAGGSFTKPGTSLADPQGAYQDRLEEANKLFGLDYYGAAMAQAFYALEIYLKVRICKHLDLSDLPTACQIHDLNELIVLSGLKTRLDNLGTHPVKINWDALAAEQKDHINDFRYHPNSNRSQS